MKELYDYEAIRLGIMRDYGSDFGITSEEYIKNDVLDKCFNEDPCVNYKMFIHGLDLLESWYRKMEDQVEECGISSDIRRYIYSNSAEMLSKFRDWLDEKKFSKIRMIMDRSRSCCNNLVGFNSSDFSFYAMYNKHMICSADYQINPDTIIDYLDYIYHCYDIMFVSIPIASSMKDLECLMYRVMRINEYVLREMFAE